MIINRLSSWIKQLLINKEQYTVDILEQNYPGGLSKEMITWLNDNMDKRWYYNTVQLFNPVDGDIFIHRIYFQSFEELTNFKLVWYKQNKGEL